jgi:hypothetical protein
LYCKSLNSETKLDTQSNYSIARRNANILLIRYYYVEHRAPIVYFFVQNAYSELSIVDVTGFPVFVMGTGSYHNSKKQKESG